MHRLISRGYDAEALVITRGLTGDLLWDALKLNYLDYYDILERTAYLNFDRLGLHEVEYRLNLQKIET